MSIVDRCIEEFDHILRTLHSVTPVGERMNPAADQEEIELSETQKQHSAGLMRVNHTGEVMAQALYQAQALTAKTHAIKQMMLHAAQEEQEHLAWCHQRLDQLNARASILNPVYYGASFVMGAGAGLLGDRISLGLVAAVEEQVGKHLQSHLQLLPPNDKRSAAIVRQMLNDEQAHAQQAIAAGGVQFPSIIQKAMTASSKAMTSIAYKL